MKIAPIPANESARLKILNELDILDTLEEQSYNDLTRLAATICQSPISLISLIDKDRQWFKSRFGIEATETHRDLSFCAHAILQPNLMVVQDARKDDRFFDHPDVVNNDIIFYAGMPLDVGSEVRVGTLCVADNKPRELSTEQLQALEAIGRQVVTLLHLRRYIKEQERIAKMKSEFVAMVSHELRTPLTSIFGSLRLMQDGSLKDNLPLMTKLLDTSVANTERLIGIVNDILDLTKFESGSFKIDRRRHNLVETVRSALEGLQSYLGQCKVTVQVHSTSEAVSFDYDHERVIQVLNNLLSNAAKFSPENSLIELTIGQTKEAVMVSVKDHGPGIPEEARASIFDKFSKLNVVDTKKLPGTGLGLAICKLIVELHGGTIWFETKVGQGTTFHFTLPL